ncbi:hypothetical protein L484_019650 [Morus notabilis]|uniref:Uncharacterized protein n=1 Tax=Morus notabilis TaxID=981085 RepID=W9QKC0_9ROSA|nr:hypothetical protein L484_019650 [Morus notabilis]
MVSFRGTDRGRRGVAKEETKNSQEKRVGVVNVHHNPHPTRHVHMLLHAYPPRNPSRRRESSMSTTSSSSEAIARDLHLFRES